MAGQTAGLIASAIEGAEALVDDESTCRCRRAAWLAVIDAQRRIAKASAPLSHRVEALCAMVDRYMPDRDN